MSYVYLHLSSEKVSKIDKLSDLFRCTPFLANLIASFRFLNDLKRESLFPNDFSDLRASSFDAKTKFSGSEKLINLRQKLICLEILFSIKLSLMIAELNSALMKFDGHLPSISADGAYIAK
jgi:hypothetical protein